MIDEDETNSMKVGRILETVNTALLQQRLKNQNDDTPPVDTGSCQESSTLTSESCHGQNMAVNNAECVHAKPTCQEPSTQTGDVSVELVPKVAVTSSVNIKSKIREAVVPPSPRTIKKRNGLIASKCSLFNENMNNFTSY